MIFPSHTDWQSVAGRNLHVGVLGLQGDVVQHLKSAGDAGATPVIVRRAEELAAVDALIIPGGESTTIDKLARRVGLAAPIRERIGAGLPVFGSCAGMVMLAQQVVDGLPDQETFGGIDMDVRRNAFGRQRESFETDLEIAEVGEPDVHAVFIRAPWVERLGEQVQVLAAVRVAETDSEHPVVVRQGNAMAVAFHPEVTHDTRLLEYFLHTVAQ